MTSYNTNNPVPSVDVRDLYDNAQNLDSLVNGPLPAYADRLGVSRKSYKGMELDFSAFLAASGFELPALDYVDGSPLVVARPTQLIERDGILYSVKPSESFPATLTGAWAADQDRVVLRADQDLRQDLANEVNPLIGAALIGRCAQVVGSIAGLRALGKDAPSKNAFVTGYYAASDGGGGAYYLDSADTITADNGGTVIVATDAGRWKLVADMPVSVLQFGAKGDGVTDDSPAFQAALNSQNSSTNRIRVPGGRSYRIGSSLIVGSGKELAGDTDVIPDEYSSSEPVTPSTLLLDEGVTITGQISSAIRGLTITKFGMVFPQSAASAAAWTGTAINLPNNGATVENCVILGFNLAISAIAHSRLRVFNTLIDCTNGILNTGSFDVSYFEGVHIWPYASIGSPDGEASHTRAGFGIKLQDVADWAKLDSCFVYAHADCYVFENVNSVTAISCGADNITGGTPTSTGFLVSGTSAAIRLVSPQAAGQNVGVRHESSGVLTITGANIWACLQHSVLINGAGGFDVLGGYLEGSAAGVSINNSSAIGSVGGVRFSSTVSLPINYVMPNNTVRVYECVHPGGSESLEGASFTGPVIPSAATVTPSRQHDVMTVSGNTSISAVGASSSYYGRSVTLLFSGALTIAHSANLVLRGGVNASITPGSLIVFSYFGNNVWREVSRNF